jgi:hypothetical protein
MREWKKTTGLVGACVAAVAAAASILAPGCNDFNGPYPCNPGYASCNLGGNANGNGNGNGNSNDNGCETAISSDPANCGACANLCAQGALCTDGKCGAAPQVLASDLSSQEPIALSDSDVFFWSTSALRGVPKSGGTEFSVYVSGNSGNGGGPASPQAFAVDDTSAYYEGFEQQPMGGSVPALLASPTSPWDGGAGPTPRVVATISQNLGGGLGEVLIESGTLFVFLQGGGGTELLSVPAGGGTLQQLATIPGNPQSPYAIDTKNVYFLETNGSCAIESAPLAGGMVSTLTSQACPSGMASDGTYLYWASNAATSNGNQCAVQIERIPVSGGSPGTFATISANEAPAGVAVDATSVYLLTNASLWAVPLAGGAPARIAGNLGGMNGQTGPGNCLYNGSSTSTSSLAVDDTNAYVAVGSTLLAIPK